MIREMTYTQSKYVSKERLNLAKWMKPKNRSCNVDKFQADSVRKTNVKRLKMLNLI